jgi:hypothetical protein
MTPNQAIVYVFRQACLREDVINRPPKVDLDITLWTLIVEVIEFLEGRLFILSESSLQRYCDWVVKAVDQFPAVAKQKGVRPGSVGQDHRTDRNYGSPWLDC